MQAMLRKPTDPGSLAPAALARLPALTVVLAGVLTGVLAPPAPASAQSGPVATASVERIEQWSEARLKEFYVGCAGASLRGLLGSSHIALCSVGYELLLKRHFGDDFDAFLAWSRSQDKAIDALPATGAQPRPAP